MNDVVKYTEDGWIGEYFRRLEFANHYGGEVYTCDMHPRLIKGMDFCRRILGRIDVTSGFRTIEFNSRPDVGGAVNSYHLDGRAADWHLHPSWGIWNKNHLIHIFKEAGFSNVGFYFNADGSINRVHTDVGPTWDGSAFNVMDDIYV